METNLTAYSEALRLATDLDENVYRLYRVITVSHAGAVVHGYTDRLSDAITSAVACAYESGTIASKHTAQVLEYRSTEAEAGWVVIRSITLNVKNVDPRLG